MFKGLVSILEAIRASKLVSMTFILTENTADKEKV